MARLFFKLGLGAARHIGDAPRLTATLSFGAALNLAVLLSGSMARAEQPAPIDRRALVDRHDPSLTRVDPSAPFMVGNGNIAMTADITGLATFPEQYSPLVPLMIQAQWAWHSFPNPQGYRLEQALVPVEVRGERRYFPWLHDWEEAKQPAIAWLRSNPHRFSLGRLSLLLNQSDGSSASFSALSEARQKLDLWAGRLDSSFVFEGQRVEVETSVHPDLDMLIVRLRSPLLAGGRLGVRLQFPGVAEQLNPNPADDEHPERHRTTLLASGRRGMRLARRVDATRYYVEARADRDLSIHGSGPHSYELRAPGGDTLTLLVLFSPQRAAQPLPEVSAARDAVARHWERYWSEGGAVDFSGSSDPRASELERRVVLSRYLTAINAAGTLPPQEEGLFSNSWNGKFHLEMHLWHAAHFAVWGHPELLERSMHWYVAHLPRARERARALGARGAWWPKMVGPEGRESPSTITPFIMWQQPSPILLSELLYRATPSREVLERYRELVFATADLLASFPHLDPDRQRYVLGPPIIPAQEVFPPLETFNPSFELEYFRFGLTTAQLWRERLGLPRDAGWDRVLEHLSAMPQRDGLYLATESQPDLWERARSPACRASAIGADCWNRDHPSFVAALGLLPGVGVDAAVMRRTLNAVASDWDLRQTWGWDFPMLAMTAARLHEPRAALDWLLRDAPNFRFGRAGMTPRMHLDLDAGRAGAAGTMATGGAAFKRDAETYFPSNGALLLAVALMAAGWDGEPRAHPGFPDDGSWVVRSEGLKPLP